MVRHFVKFVGMNYFLHYITNAGGVTSATMERDAAVDRKRRREVWPGGTVFLNANPCLTLLIAMIPQTIRHVARS